MELVCGFTGHRPQSLPNGGAPDTPACRLLREELVNQITILATSAHVHHFITGMARGVDLWAAEAVLALRGTCPVTLTCAVPYAHQGENWPTDDRQLHARILQESDRVAVLSERYYGGCFLARNRWIAEHSHLLLAVYNGQKTGGTAYTVRYAVGRGQQVVVIDPLDRRVYCAGDDLLTEP